MVINNQYLLALHAVLYSTVIFYSNYSNGFFVEPEFQICDSIRLRKFRRNFCANKLVFTSNTTKINSDCICVSGIWLLINRDCVPSTIISNEGCVLSPQIKAMQYLGTFGRDDFFAVVARSELDYSYSVLRPVQSDIVNGQVWLLNGTLSKSDNGSYCAEKRRLSNKKTIKLKDITRHVIRGRLTVQYECPPYYTKPVSENLHYNIRTPETSECKLECTRISSSKLVIKKEMKTAQNYTKHHRHHHSNHFLKTPTRKHKDMNKVKNGNATNTTGEPSVPQSIKSLIYHLHRRLLIKALEYGYSESQFGMDSKSEYIPQASFRVLEMFQRIVFKTCAGKVPEIFLEFAFVMFRVAYENRGTNLMEYLKNKEEADIMQFLNDCHESIVPMKFNLGSTFCPDEPIKTVYKNGQHITVSVSENYTDDFYLKSRHLTVEIPWNMLDLTIGMCINAFADSYILYHKMEQAIEKLFVKDLKILWKFPPEMGTLYTRLYGPYWKHYAESLEKCVEAVYIHNPKLTRLRRPEAPITKNVYLKAKIGKYNYLGNYEPIQIPEITIEKRQSISPAPPPPPVNRITSLLASVDLACQSLEASECLYD